MGLHLPRRARSRARPLATGAAVVTGLLLLGACSSRDESSITRLAMPSAATSQGPEVFELWKWSWLAAILVGILVWGLMGYAVVRYRRRSPDEVPVQTRYHLPIEIFYTIAPVVMVIVLFFYTVQTQNELLENPDHPDHTVGVVGQQWSWSFNYMGEEAVGGDNVYTVGTTAEIPTLWLPVNETVRFNLSSPDVIHSFWVPAFLFKMDVVPGRDNHFTVTPDREGTYKGKCAELCGAYHSRMLFDVKVVSAQEYAAHLQQLKDQGNVGVVTGASRNRIVPGLDAVKQARAKTEGEGQ